MIQGMRRSTRVRKELFDMKQTLAGVLDDEDDDLHNSGNELGDGNSINSSHSGSNHHHKNNNNEEEKDDDDDDEQEEEEEEEEDHMKNNKDPQTKKKKRKLVKDSNKVAEDGLVKDEEEYDDDDDYDPATSKKINKRSKASNAVINEGEEEIIEEIEEEDENGQIVSRKISGPSNSTMINSSSISLSSSSSSSKQIPSSGTESSSKHRKKTETTTKHRRSTTPVHFEKLNSKPKSEAERHKAILLKEKEEKAKQVDAAVAAVKNSLAAALANPSVNKASNPPPVSAALSSCILIPSISGGVVNGTNTANATTTTTTNNNNNNHNHTSTSNSTNTNNNNNNASSSSIMGSIHQTNDNDAHGVGVVLKKLEPVKRAKMRQAPSQSTSPVLPPIDLSEPRKCSTPFNCSEIIKNFLYIGAGYDENGRCIPNRANDPIALRAERLTWCRQNNVAYALNMAASPLQTQLVGIEYPSPEIRVKNLDVNDLDEWTPDMEARFEEGAAFIEEAYVAFATKSASVARSNLLPLTSGQAPNMINSYNSNIRPPSVFVHCVAGVNRSPMVVVWWLARYHGLSVHDAWELVRIRRDLGANWNGITLGGPISQEDQKKDFSAISSSSNTVTPTTANDEGKAELPSPTQEYKWIEVPAMGSSLQEINNTSSSIITVSQEANTKPHPKLSWYHHAEAVLKKYSKPRIPSPNLSVQQQQQQQIGGGIFLNRPTTITSSSIILNPSSITKNPHV